MNKGRVALHRSGGVEESERKRKSFLEFLEMHAPGTPSLQFQMPLLV
jgi:hypothetical protein